MRTLVSFSRVGLGICTYVVKVLRKSVCVSFPTECYNGEKQLLKHRLKWRKTSQEKGKDDVKMFPCMQMRASAGMGH
jgi:hypothetical protein